MPVKINSPTFGWAGNYAVLHSAANHIHRQLQTRGQKFQTNQGDWTHLRALIVEMRTGRTAIVDGRALTGVALAATKVENDATYDINVEYSALDAALATLIGTLATIYNTAAERIYSSDGAPITQALTVAQNNTVKSAIGSVIALFTVG